MIRHLLSNQVYPENMAVIENGREIRYRELLQKAQGVQRLLPQKQQENIAILLPDGSDYIAAFWGTIQGGMTAFPLNLLMTGYEILPLLRQANVNTVITTTPYQYLFEEMAEIEKRTLKIIFMDELITLIPEHKFPAVNINETQPMLLLGTSGTTGKSKIVQLSERNVESAVLGYLDRLHFNETDLNETRYTLAVPFSSVYGVMILSVCLMRSFPIVVLNNNFTLDGLYQSVEKHKITHYEGSASPVLLMEKMADRAIPYNIHTLKYVGFGGSKVSGRTIEKLLKAYPGVGFYQGYGMTEAAPLIAKHPQGKLEKTESVGKAIKESEILIEANNVITNTPFTEGEIIVRGPNIMLGYLKNKSETDQVLKNGCLYTGDIGYLDNEGYLYICGRKKNIVIVHGFTVHPEEIETCIQNSLLVQDCFVYGQRDNHEDEVLCVDIVPMDSQVSEEKIRKYCNTHLAEYKRPHKISFCKSINKNISWKNRAY